MIAKCIPQCWFCKGKCDICFSPAKNSLILYKQQIMYCDSSCRGKIIPSPPVESALPEKFSIKNEFDGTHAVKVADGHTILAHITTEYGTLKHDKQLAYLTLFLCRAGEAWDNRLYVLCHIHSLVEQFSLGMFISVSDFVPLELIPGSNCSTSHSIYVNSLYSSGIIPMLLLKISSKLQVGAINEIAVQGNERYDY